MEGDKELYNYIASITPSLMCQRTSEVIKNANDRQ